MQKKQTLKYIFVHHNKLYIYFVIINKYIFRYIFIYFIYLFDLLNELPKILLLES